MLFSWMRIGWVSWASEHILEFIPNCKLCACLLNPPYRMCIIAIDLMHWRHVSITTTPCWGSRLVARCAHVLCWQSALALSLSVSARARASPAVWHAGVGPLAACLAIAHVAVSRLTPNTRGRPSVTSYAYGQYSAWKGIVGSVSTSQK